MSSTSTYEAAVATQRQPGLESRDGSLHPRELVRLGSPNEAKRSGPPSGARNGPDTLPTVR